MTITPDDILAEQRLRRGSRGRGRCAAGAGRVLRTLDRWRARSSSASSATPRPARRRITRGLVRVLGEEQRHARLHRRLPPLRPPPARRAQHHAAPSRLQLHRHHGAAPRAPARRRAVPEAGLPAHRTAPSGRSFAIEPERFSVVEGLLGYYTDELRGIYDVRVYLAPPEELRRQLEGAARLLAARLHDRPGADRARPPRARLGGVHPPAAAATPTSSSRSCRA